MGIGQHTNGCQDQDIPSQARPVQDLVTNTWELSVSFRVHGRVQALPGLTCSPEETPPAALVNPTWREQGAPVSKELQKPQGPSPPRTLLSSRD